MRLTKLCQVLSLVFPFMLMTGMAAAEDLVLLNTCGADVRSCVTMDVRLVWGDRQGSSLDGHPYFDGADGPSSDELQPFTAWFFLSGRLQGKTWAIHRVGLAAQYHAMQCDDGLLDIAVLGFESDGDPVVLSDRGPLVLSRSAIVVGCPACLAVLPRDGAIVGWHTTPSIEGDVDGNRSVLPQSDGTLFIEGSEACVQIFPDRRFRIADSAQCRVISLTPLKESAAPASFGALLDRWPGLTPEEVRSSLYGTDRSDRIVFWLRQACT